MAKRFNEKRAKAAEFAIEKELNDGYGKTDFEGLAGQDVRDAAMGRGETELFEKKLSKEEKKAAAKAAREAKKKAKDEAKGPETPEKGDTKGGGKKSKGAVEPAEEKKDAETVLELTRNALDARAGEDAKKEELLEKLSQEQIIVTYESKKGQLHANTRDINVGGVTVTFHGKPLIEETEITINYGNRYGFIGPNGSGE
jgi:ATP-binding cassette, subfamily F, member 2